MNETRESIVTYIRDRAKRHRDAAVKDTSVTGTAHKATAVLYDALAGDIVAELDVQ